MKFDFRFSGIFVSTCFLVKILSSNPEIDQHAVGMAVTGVVKVL